MLVDILFYVFASITLVSALVVIASRHPVYSVLSLIVAFFNSAALFVLLGAEFLAMLLVIVYVGAVAVLFLFVVMMLNINTARMKEGFLRYLPVGLLIAIGLFVELRIAVMASLDAVPQLQTIASGVDNTMALGLVLYTDYLLLFQVAGLILLVAMIGAIVLAHRTRKDVRKQNITDQLLRRDTVQLVKVRVGEGVKS